MSVLPTRGPSPDPAGHAAVTVCWAAKGGSGTSVVTAALALTAPPPVVLVDLAGDLPLVLGLPEPGGPGVHEWLASDAPAAQLHDLTIGATDEVVLLPAGTARATAGRDRWDELVSALGSDDHTVLIDAGTGPPPADLHQLADRTLLVTRACYLALRRAITSPLRPSAVVLVSEHGRALRTVDVETAIGAPVVASVAIDPAVARAVDAGLLTARLPRIMQRELRGAA